MRFSGNDRTPRLHALPVDYRHEARPQSFKELEAARHYLLFFNTHQESDRHLKFGWFNLDHKEKGWRATLAVVISVDGMAASSG